MSAAVEVRVEQLLGRKVVDAAGEKVGHIEDIVAVRHGDELVVREFLTGETGTLSRLSVVTSRSVLFFVHLLAGRLAGRRAGYRIKWDEMDLSDPEHPKALLPRDRLRGRQP